MATALKLEPACTHDALIPYDRVGGGMDDVETVRGRCPECGNWYELTTWISSGYIEERPLDAGEIANLRRAELV